MKIPQLSQKLLMAGGGGGTQGYTDVIDAIFRTGQRNWDECIDFIEIGPALNPTESILAA
jgi:hypothetical protein